MESLLYWVLFSVLLTLLVVILSWLGFNIVVDLCLEDPEREKDTDNNESIPLNRCRFNRHDVEDLTRIEGNYKTVSPRLSFKNEVERSKIDKMLQNKDSRRSNLSNIQEELSLNHSIGDSVSSVNSTLIEDTVHKVKEKKVISQSLDNLEFCDPSGIDVLRDIHKIEAEAEKIDHQLNYFVGSTKELKYYETNEALLRLMITLCDLTLESEELRKKKIEVLSYIENCQKKLKEKATSTM